MLNSEAAPLIFCRLTDQDGHILNPYAPDAILYTELSEPANMAAKNIVTVLIEGFVTVFSDEGRLSAPTPFCIIKNMCLYAPPRANVRFKVSKFHCCMAAVPCAGKEDAEISVYIESIAQSVARVSLRVPQMDSVCQIKENVCINVDRIYDSVTFESSTRFPYEKMLLKAAVYQYNALSDGVRRVYTNADELTEYGHLGILSPSDVSYCNLFINGIMQPRANYRLEEGILTLTTTDVPPKGETVIITFVTLTNNADQKLAVTNRQYTAIADGTKRVFTDRDALKPYGSAGIPDPEEISYFNLYVNSVLQPPRNYSVRRGVLTLNTADLPKKGETVILESLTIKDWDGQLLRVVTYQYNALSDEKRIFTNKDELTQYGNSGIPNPANSSYENLYSNGVRQPCVCYWTEEGILRLKTFDAPIKGAPVSLQAIGKYVKADLRKYSFSDLASDIWAERNLCGIEKSVQKDR